ncbi:hypothetical protein DMB44_00410 [Thermoplasma sp. Kam2015]|uniref:hypothetical protein n=1 Tax=Thermoplasma sp. Kam2015 TaxID=2094122 RepID=UPI000D859670|nr:hypothetical protein [Thermoplasma sp. Kam2015]PYB69057.1 hypothetical protein DMB44_00410 [Thermoplasma sp. Kam2015]
MLQKVDKENNKDHETSMDLDKNNIIKVLFPTRCNDDLITSIYAFIKMFSGKISVDFLNILPPTENGPCMKKNIKNSMYDRAIAEKELYKFVKKLPKRENLFYNYRVAEGELSDIILNLSEEGNYNMIAIEAKEFCSHANNIIDVMKLLDSVGIPIIFFEWGKGDSEIHNYKDVEEVKV